MTVRVFDIGRQPWRVVVDSKLRIPLDRKILQGGNTLVVCHSETPQADALSEMGVTVLAVPGEHEQVDLSGLMQALAERGINEVLVEAGNGLNGALLQQNLADEVLLYFAPTLLGSDAQGMFGLGALTEMTQRIDLELLALDQIGQDIRVRARPRR